MIRVFPSGRMCSLRGVLMMWLLPVFGLVGTVSAAGAYWTYSNMVTAFMDDQMTLLATSLVSQRTPPSLPPVSRQQVHEWGTYAVQLFGSGQALESSSLPELRVDYIQTPGFHDVRAGGEGWRVFVADTPGAQHVQVVQSDSFRAHLAAGRALGVISPVILLLLLSWLVLWGVVEMISRAIGDIARQAATQDENTIAELPLTHVPREITPLVMSFNSLLGRLRTAFTTQRRFVQDAAHELRTPIAAIGLQLETLRGDVCCGETQERFKQLEQGVQRAQRLVDQLLRLSRQEATAGDAAQSDVDVTAVLRESVNGLILLAEQKHIDLGLLPTSVSHVALRCPVADLRSVLDNLIENALRYTPEGGVVDVRLAEEGDRLVIEVIDSGPGIPPELMERVFDRFFRVPGTDVRGNGLGLAIARGAAQRCGMQLSLRNRSDANGLIARVETC
ncbi:MAG: sensor histidine kinase [Ramlibacter sp.]|nr:two-component sensor histidine kinase [Ramlibacter sp.]